jgi:STAM-binding protein
LSDLKPTLVERYERWLAQHPGDDTAQPSPGPSNAYAGNTNPRRPDPTRRQDDPYARVQDDRDRGRQQAEATRRDDQNRYEDQRRVEALKEDARRKAQEEMDRRQREDMDMQRKEIARRDDEQRGRGANDPDLRHKEEIVAAARWTAGMGQQVPYGAPQNDTGGPSSAINLDAQRRQQEFDRQQAEMKRREEEIVRARTQGDIARRQEEADAAARATRQNLASAPSYPSAPQGVGPSRVPSFPDPQMGNDMPLPMPLESPTRYDDEYSTDRESVTDDQAPWHRSRNQPAGTPTRAPVRSYVISTNASSEPYC